MTVRLAIIGAGNMGSAIARGAVRSRIMPAESILLIDQHPDRLAPMAELGCLTASDPRRALEAEQVLLAVKPHHFAELAAELGPIDRAIVVVSIMAGLDSAGIRDALGDGARVIRTMPNTPCQLGEGMTGIAIGSGAEPGDERLARELFEALGRTALVEESLMHAVTAVSGSGPAYVYLLAELMQNAAAATGLDERTAHLLVVQTIIGAGRMLRESGASPEALRQVVTTPNGTTAAALDVFLDRDLPGTIVDAITAARDRGVALADA